MDCSINLQIPLELAKHLLEVLIVDTEGTVDMHSVNPGDLYDATPEVVAYLQRSNAAMVLLKKGLFDA